MPYQSGAQRRWAHTPEGEKALGGPSKVAEWDAASKGRSIPDRVGDTTMNKGYRGKTDSFAQGGPVLGRQRDFLKEQVEFRDPREGKMGASADADQEYAKSGEGKGTGIVAPPPAKGKSEKPVKPRS